MLILLSPSKTHDLQASGSNTNSSLPFFPKEAATLMKQLKKMKVGQLEEVVKISPKLAWQVQERIALWQPEFTLGNTNQALYLFKGEVYHGLDTATLPVEAGEYAQLHLRILSGLYGVIRPLDRIQPHRLEMETALRFGKYESLYHFWREKITRQILVDLKESGSNLLINLASQEYSSALEMKKLKAKIVAPQFLEGRNDSYQMITVYAKKAR